MKSAARPGRKPLSLGVFSPTPGMGQWVLTDLQHETEEVDAMAARRAAPARFSRLLLWLPPSVQGVSDRAVA
jgi:hypothetical protein